MEVEEIQAQPCKFPRIGNGNNRAINNTSNSNSNSNSNNPGAADEEDQDPSCLDLKRVATTPVDAGNRLRGWHHSRIIRVSRASGGKDRHSKVWTSKGLRDRRVRLSVTTAIQFYDLQDRLGYDQPSKAVEWLIKKAADDIAELPSLNNCSFPDTPKQLSDEKRASCEHGFDSAEIELDGQVHQDLNYHQQNQTQNQSQYLSLSKSACSSNSETSKGSGLSLSRSEIRVNRVKARERARERAAKDKEKETNDSASHNIAHHHSQNNISSNSLSAQSASFTELLTGGIGTNSSNSPTASAHQQQSQGGEPILFHKPAAAASPAAMDYFSSGLLGLSSSTRTHHSSGFSGQIHLGMNSIPQAMSVVSPFNVSGDHHNNHHHNHSSELQHFSFVPDHLIPVTTSSQPGNGGDYNLNFSISSSGGLAGFNRGTLQSNSSSPSFLAPHPLQRFSPIDGSSNVPFFIGAAAAAASPSMENHHHHQQQFPAGFDRGLQQLYGDGTRHSDHKGKAKN